MDILDTGGGNCTGCGFALRAVVKMLNVKEGWCLRIGLFCVGIGQTPERNYAKLPNGITSNG